MSSSLFLLVSFLTLVLTLGDYGPCRYDADRCSCKYGEEFQGLCWDRITASPGTCKRRYCKPGWTCSCGGRTHVCTVAKKSVTILKDPADKNKPTAECTSKSVSLVTGRELYLGTFKIFLSKAGVAANDCTQVAWWLDGKLHGYHEEEDDMKKDHVDDVLKERQEHSLLELKSDSLIAFRIRNGSYYCFKHFAEMVVNGVHKNTKSAGVTVHYARQFVPDWYMPRYKLTPERMGKDENDEIWKFIPLRTKLLTTSESIIPGNDYWALPDGKTHDTRRSNWYYRIQMSKHVTG